MPVGAGETQLELPILSDMIVEKAYPSDFEQIYPVLQDYMNPNLEKHNWEKLFTQPWSQEEGFCGFKIVTDGLCVAFLGCLFSRREIDGETHKFVNMSSLLVKNAYRRKGLARKLFSAVTDMEEYTVWSTTANQVSAGILRDMGFQDLGCLQTTISPGRRSFLPRRKLNICFDHAVIESQLDSANAKLLRDHLGFGCIHFLLQEGGRSCYGILTKTPVTEKRFLRLHYLSDTDFFLGNLSRVRSRLCREHKVDGILADPWMIKEVSTDECRTEEIVLSKLVRTNVDLDKLRDTLYSEFFLLDL